MVHGMFKVLAEYGDAMATSMVAISDVIRKATEKCGARLQIPSFCSIICRGVDAGTSMTEL